MELTIDADVLDVLRRSSATERVLTLPAQQLNRELYTRVDKVLKCLGGKWDRKIRGHLFVRSAAEVLAGIIETGEYSDKKKELQFFETPIDVCEGMRDIAAILPSEAVLEPSAGRGRLIAGVRARVTACEIDPDNCAILRANFPTARVVEGDFLKWRVSDGGISIDDTGNSFGLFDVVLMNPPFTRNQDIRHVRAAWQCVRPGGRLVSITSPHYTFSSDRESVEFLNFLAMIEAESLELPEGAFKESGTNIRARMIWAEKP